MFTISKFLSCVDFDCLKTHGFYPDTSDLKVQPVSIKLDYCSIKVNLKLLLGNMWKILF